jgi:hypothetical protein
MSAKPPRPPKHALGSPTISVALYASLSAVNDHVIRRFVATFPRPGKNWADPDVTAMRVMFGAALETAVVAALQSVQAPIDPPLPADIPRDASVGPWPADEETTKPMPKRAKPHG